MYQHFPHRICALSIVINQDGGEDEDGGQEEDGGEEDLNQEGCGQLEPKQERRKFNHPPVSEGYG